MDPPFLGINLMKEYQIGFDLLKTKMNNIIQDYHIKLSGSNSQTSV
jgi:hypothetical protein